MECWNNGILEKMDFGILELWSAKDGTIKLKMDNILLRTHYSIIPQFHYSMVDVKTQSSKTPNIFINL
jgi:hypothetical protein